jgi:hypothetical protein
MGRTKRVFHWVAEPRVQRVAFFVVYLLHVVAGLAIIVGQPPSVANEIGHGLTTAWGMFLVFGGIVGAIAVLPGWNFVERIGITSVFIGVSLCSVVIASTPWSHLGVQIATWALVTGWAVIFALRAYEIRYYIVAPRIRG